MFKTSLLQCFSEVVGLTRGNEFGGLGNRRITCKRYEYYIRTRDSKSGVHSFDPHIAKTQLDSKKSQQMLRTGRLRWLRSRRNKALNIDS